MKRTYCSKLFNWFIHVGLVQDNAGQYSLVSKSPKELSLIGYTSKRRHRYSFRRKEGNLFWGQTSPDTLIDVYNRIKGGETSYKVLKDMGLRNGIEILSAANGIVKYGDNITLVKTLNEILDYISESLTIKLVRELVNSNPHIKGSDVGESLNTEFSRNWDASSKYRYGHALLRWYKYLDIERKQLSLCNT